MHLNLNVDLERLRKESQLGDFEPFLVQNYNFIFENWLVREQLAGEYSKQLVQKLTSIVGSSHCKARVFKLKRGNDIFMHKDDGTKCAINIVLSNPDDGVTFEKYGEIKYRFALLNTQERHGVFNITEDRVLFKISIFDLDYSYCCQKFLALE